ncbi:preprotein translocase subunit SecG [Bathymodiolus platifrons methanotrophic gill symbiont]|uniref:preprotein translocase subunit SecG n=1 Tax=Bathymodiolus platifrons methanotrophic gill symbiont TaxID=113268 RepID=UPI000B418A62|nr:preprotein translocase subunit SecG [Bathymodiolus platifrons methanotrophic gill symbiont]MCK5870804.1 preprotein translocase subunit SecG [Methyloprofundus sp.]TXK98117.1 preprotein translocase subunit SecG [Methylococcaceae bacterium CS4]TXK98818.1 preprotein translocase subunit SecG [Methylococcaceae bacterium HT1]TXK99635.1 preprotein translocase subunit SecG [Methylococcaceae bacterium CS5]TXL05293.1 preprotein translocase subunit SecG [Methylococcaceae bacterium CS1]TXL07996.1 prepr
MYQVIIIGHVLVGIAVIGLVLIQHGKGADAGAAFGSGSSGTVFGAQGSASFLSRTTGILAAVFFSTSLGLAILSGNTGSDADIMDIPVAEQLQAEIPVIEGEQVILDEPVMVEAEVPQVAIEEAVPGIVAEDAVIEEAIVTEEGVPGVVVDEVVTP